MSDVSGWQLGDRVRTKYDGEVFPGVYKIVGFSPGGGAAQIAQLESEHNNSITWSPVTDLERVTTPPPCPLSHKEASRIIAFVDFIKSLDDEKAGAALTLLNTLLESVR